MDHDDEHVLELSAIAPVRQKTRIRTSADPEGTLYEIRVPEELGVRELRAIGNEVTEILELWEGVDSAAKEKRLDTLLNTVAGRLIVDVPAKTIKAMPRIQKRALAMGFLARCGELAQAAIGTQDLVRFLLGTSSHVYNGSTEATP